MFPTRRKFLHNALGSTALLSLTPSMPRFLFDTSACAAGKGGDNVLVVVQLSGGNDGLNTVVPFTHDEYQKGRVALRIDPGQVVKVTDEIGLHPSLSGLRETLEAGRLSILQGIGYPNPNRSHFESMDIWHTARVQAARDSGGRQTGWIGRYLDLALPSDGRDVPALHLGMGRQPLAMVGENPRAASVQSLEAFRLEDGGDAKLRGAVEAGAAEERPSPSDLLRFLQRSTVSALSGSARVQEAIKAYDSPVTYPPTALAAQLRTVAQLVEAGLSTRVYYVSLDGFDTHAGQLLAHAGLLQQLGDAIAAFTKDLQHHGHADRVTLVTFSEFGRRVKENASAGTDHGVAGPMFVVGPKVKPGLVGDHPSLTDLDEGDLKPHTDFRSVYATLLEQWLGYDSEKVLGGKFEPVAVFA